MESGSGRKGASISSVTFAFSEKNLKQTWQNFNIN